MHDLVKKANNLASLKNNHVYSVAALVSQAVSGLFVLVDATTLFLFSFLHIGILLVFWLLLIVCLAEQDIASNSEIFF